MEKRRLTKEEWRKQIADCRASGRRREDYCAEQRLHPKTMAWWERTLARGAERAATVSTKQGRFVEVTGVLEATPADTRLELQVGQVIVRVSMAFDADMLGRVLSVLEARR